MQPKPNVLDGKIDGGYLVVKRNELIEASYRLSLQEQRIILCLCSQIRPDDEDFKIYKFTAKDLAEVIGITHKDFYSELKKTTKLLANRSLTVYKTSSELQTGWLSSAEYFDKQGYVELCFDPKLRPYLLQVKENFTRYPLGPALSFKSKYSLRIYELAHEWEFCNKHIFDLNDFRKILGLRDKELSRYTHFRSRVIEPAIKEINEKASFNISIIPKKTGRAITHLILEVNTKSILKPQLEKPQNAPEIDSLLDLIPDSFRGLKATKNKLIKALQHHDATYVKQQIEYTNKKSPKKESYLNYLGKAIDDNYAELEIEMADEKKKISEAEREKKLAEYRLMSDKDIKDLAERGNDYAKTILYERAQTTITWTEAPVEPAQAPVESADSIWTDDQLAEMAAGGNARAQAILSERIRAQIPR